MGIPRRPPSLALVAGALVLLLDGTATVASSAVVCAGQQSLLQRLGGRSIFPRSGSGEDRRRPGENAGVHPAKIGISIWQNGGLMMV